MNNSNHILQILMSLLIEVAAPNNQNLQVTTSDGISNKLANAGLNKKELVFILMWLRNFTKLPKVKKFDYQPNAIRIFSKEEKTIIPKKCLDFLLKSHRDSQINAMELEFIINQVMVLNSKNITESQFMWIYDMTLANQQSQDILMNIKDQPLPISFAYH